jgi:hypothetical protein
MRSFIAAIILVVAGPCWAGNPGLLAEPDHRHRGIRREIAPGWTLPYEKTYEQLTPEEKELLRSAYEDLAADDEPPYPLSGMGKITRQIAQAQQTLLVKGRAAGFAMIDANGDVTDISFFEMPNEETAKVIAFVYMRAKFKPAKCHGVPCSMGFPIAIAFSLRP